MSSPIKKWMPLIVLPFLLAVCFTLWFTLDTAPSVPIQSEGDIWDLREFDFSDPNAIAKLKGPVAYIPNAILTPEEFEARSDEIVYGYPEDNVQYATSRMRVLVPDGWYGFTCLSVDFSERLYVNGRLMFEIGSPGDSRETNVPDTKNQIMTLAPVDGAIEIVVQGANFVHREGGGHAGWRVGNPDALYDGLKGAYLTDIVMGCYLALFLVHMILFLLLKTYRANLLFALSCLMWFLRSGVTWTKVFSVLFPSMSWFVKFRIEYLAFPVTAMLFIALVHTLFPRVLQKWYLYAMTGAMAVFAVLFLFADTLLMSWAILLCEGIFYASILYIAVRFVMKLRCVSPEQAVFLMGAALFVYAVVNDMLYYNNIYVFPFISGDLSQISMLIFAFFEAVAIFIATARGIEEAKVKEQQLAARVQMTESQIALQREQYAALMQNVERDRAVRHDLRHQLTLIKRSVNDGETEKTNAYIDELTSGIAAFRENLYCENYAVNAVVGHYLSTVENEDIKLDVCLNIPENTGRVSDMDLCVIMGNLLENAVEACKRMERGERFINLYAEVRFTNLFIVMDNSFDGACSEKDGAFLSRKRNGRGIGLTSVKSVAEKYGGSATFKTEDSVFLSSVMIRMESGDRCGDVS